MLPSINQLRPSTIALLAVVTLACSEDEPPTPPGGGGGDSLADLVAAASAGDTVRVAGGVHAVSATILVGADQDGLVILGRTPSLAGEDRPVLLGDMGAGVVIDVENGASDVEIRGLELTGTFGVGVRVGAAGVVVSDCWIEGATDDAVSLVGSGSGHISRSVLTEAGRFGVDCESGTSGDILENTIAGAGDCGIRTVNATPVIDRNVIYDSSNFGVACFGTSPALSCNVIYMSGNTNYSSGCVPGADDIEKDPLFCGDGSFAVTNASPCLPGETCGWIGAVQATCVEKRGRW